MNGWSGPSSSGGDPRTPPVVGWAAPSDEGLAVGGTMSAGWVLTRAHLGDLAAVAAIPIGLWTLTLLPFWVTMTQLFDAWVRFFSETDFRQYAGDPDALRRDMDAIFRPATNLSLVAGLSAALGVVIVIVGAAAVAQATLDATRGRDITLGHAFGAVADHAGAIVGPAIALGAAYLLVFVPFGLSQGSATTGAGTAAISIVYLGLTVLSWIVLAAVVYFAVRWAVVLQVILAEDRGLVPALTRSGTLSQGVRVRIAVVLVAAGFLVGLALSIPIWIAAIVGWLVTGSVGVGMGVYLLGLAFGGLVGLPFLMAMLTVIYGRRVAAVDGAAPAGPDPAEPAG
jgi:hypothetical protein